MKRIFSPIQIVSQLDGKLTIFNNGFVLDYVTLHYYKHGHANEENIILEQATPYFVIEDIKESGLYHFYTTNPSGAKSAEMVMYITIETKKELFNRLERYISTPVDAEYVHFIFEVLRADNAVSYPLIKRVLRLYKRLVDPQKYELQSFYQVISTIERFEALQAISMNQALKLTGYSYGANTTLRPNMFTTHIDVIEIVSDYKEKFYRRIIPDLPDEPITIPGKSNTLYRIELYCESELLGGWYHYQFDTLGESYFWNKELESISTINEQMIADFQIAHTDIPITSQQIQWLLEERAKKSMNYIVPRIYATRGSFDGDIDITISHFELLKESGKSYFICGKEFDLFTDDNFDRNEKLTKGYITFNTYKHNIVNNCILYIKDENNNIVSGFTRYNENGEFTDYELTKQLIDVNDYMKQLLKELRPYITGTNLSDFITSAIIQQTHNSDVEVDTVALQVIKAIAQARVYIPNKTTLLYAVLINWFNRFTIDDEFFEHNIASFYHATQRLSFSPRESPFVVIHIGFNTDTEPVYNYTAGSSEEAIALLTNKYDYNIFYSIDMNSYHRSPFVFIDNVKNEECMISNLLRIEEDVIDG